MYIQLDLCNFDSVVSFVEGFISLKLPLHGLINNAGIMTDDRHPTAVCQSHFSWYRYNT